MSEQRWYYASNGFRQGPFSADQMVDLEAAGTISLETDVWCDNTVGQWRPLRDTLLGREILRQRTSPTPDDTDIDSDKTQWHYYTIKKGSQGPVSTRSLRYMMVSGEVDRDAKVWHEAMPEWAPLGATELGRKFWGNVPPPLLGDNINNNLVWMLAIAPLWVPLAVGFFMGAIYGDLAGYKWVQLQTGYGWLIIFAAVNTALCSWDAIRLRAAGHDEINLGWIWLVPVYLYQRAQKLKQPLHYFIGWCACFVLSLFV